MMNENVKKIWITGASSGIGKALAIKFAKEGWKVAASARRENLLNDLNNQNQNIYSFPVDVKNKDEVKNVFQNIIEKFKTIDISVFCTGIHDPDSEKKLSSEKIREIMETNFFGTLNCIMAVNTYFREKKNGHISIVSSVAGYRGLPAASGYCASKAALQLMTQTMAVEFGPYNVQANCIAPTVTMTPMGESAWPPSPRRDAKLSKIPTGRFAEPDEVAKTVVFLASSQADFINGIELPIDGGEGAG